MIDKNATFSPILHLKNNWNVRQLDYVGVTHPHLDHIDDILNFDEVSPKSFLQTYSNIKR
jgi:competence protein ComEC